MLVEYLFVLFTALYRSSSRAKSLIGGLIGRLYQLFTIHDHTLVVLMLLRHDE